MSSKPVEPVAFQCTCSSQRVRTVWIPANPHISTKPYLSHRCLECGRTGGTIVEVSEGIATLSEATVWEGWRSEACSGGDETR